MILFISNVDTEILALRTAVEALPHGFGPVRAAQPWTVDGVPDLTGVRCVLVRLLRGRRAWLDGFDALRAQCAAQHVPFLAFSGEAVPDAELTSLSTAPSGIVTEAFRYLVNGGPANFENLLRFVADTVLREGFGFDPPTEIPAHGVWREPPRRDPDRPLVAVVFYRAHLVAGNTQFVADLCATLEASGADAIAWWCYSLRDEAAADALVALVREHGVDVVVTTVLAAGGITAGAGTAGRPGGVDGDTWDILSLIHI